MAYKTIGADARALAQNWYDLSGVPATPQGLDWWQKQIQQDGSNTAFQNFASGIAKDHGAAQGQTLAQNAQAYQKQTGLSPVAPLASSPFKGQAQLPGTNTKTLPGDVADIVNGGGTFTKDFFRGIGKNPLSIVTGFDPLSTSLWNTIRGTHYKPVINQLGGPTGDTLAKVGPASAASFGIANDIAGALGGGAAAGAVGSAVGHAAGGGLAGGLAGKAAATALPLAVNAASKNVGDNTGTSATATPSGGGTDLSSLLSLPGISSVLGSLGTTIPSLLEGVNAANLQNQSTQYAKDALATQQGLFDQQAPLRTAGIAGLLNPSTPAPGLANIQALSSIAGRGNPFANPAGTAIPSAPGLSAPQSVNNAPVPAGVTAPPVGGLSPVNTLPKPVPTTPPANVNALQPSY